MAGGIFTAADQRELDELEAREAASVAQAAPPPDVNDPAFHQTIDQQGASFLTRAIVDPTRDEDREATLANMGFTDIRRLKDGNFVYVDPSSGKRILYNPPGIDVGDVAGLARPATQMIGAAGGAAVGAVSPVPGGTIVGAGIGTAAGGDVFDRLTEGAGRVDTRTPGERLTDRGIEATSGAVGQAVSPVVAKGISAAATGGVSAASKGVQKLAGAVEDFKAIGETPSLGEAGSMFSQIVEGLAKRSVGGIRKLRGRSRQVLESFDKAVERQATRLGATSPQRAGGIAKRGIEGFVEGFKGKGKILFDEISNFVPDNFPVRLSNMRGILDELVAVDPLAPRTTGRFVNSTLRGISDDLAADAAENGGVVGFNALKLIRSRVGAKLTNPSFVDDVGRAEWKRLYAAITEDMKATIEAHGRPGAMKAFEAANKFWREGIAKIDDVLEPLVNGKFPERVFSALQSSGKAGSSLLKEVRGAVTKTEWRVLMGTALRDMGKATAANQDATGAAFSINTFFTNYAKLSPQTRAVMFNNIGMPGFRSNLDKLARVAERIIKAERFFGNPSGTGQIVAAGAPILAGVGALGAGNLGTAGLLLAGLPAMTRGAAQFVTSPKLVKWLAQGAKIPSNRIGSHLGRLVSIGATSDSETKEAIREYLNVFASLPKSTTEGAQPRRRRRTGNRRLRGPQRQGLLR